MDHQQKDKCEQSSSHGEFAKTRDKSFILYGCGVAGLIFTAGFAITLYLAIVENLDIDLVGIMILVYVALAGATVGVFIDVEQKRRNHRG